MVLLIPYLATVVNGKITDITGIGTGHSLKFLQLRSLPVKVPQFTLKFDRFGRILEVEVTNGGQYYLDIPTFQVVLMLQTVVRVLFWDQPS